LNIGVNLAILKPLLSALVLPPAGPILLTILGFALIFFSRKASTRKANTGKAFISIGLVFLWILSCQAFAVKLDAWLLKPYAALTEASLNRSNAQAVVVLGSGMQSKTSEYQNSAQLSATAAVRLRYGAWLSKQTKLPLAFSGGRGWATGQGMGQTEAQGAANYLKSLDLPPARWLDDQSSDTAENAIQMAKLMPQDKRNILLVTHAWHMERSVKLFEAQGFTVLPAPAYAIASDSYALLNWLPSGQGLQDSRNVLREVLALLVMRIRG
jgi:uncharacterized SAM-binding protein YcdF (DUF218 family)